MTNSDKLQDALDRIENEDSFDQETTETFKSFVREYYYNLDFGPDSVKLSQFKVDQFNNLSDESIEPNSENLVIYGQNSEGKTSLLRAIQFNLLGLPERNNKKRKFGLTDVIQSGKKRAVTAGQWDIDRTPTLIQREIRRDGKELVGYNRPIVEVGTTSLSGREDSRDRDSTVFETVGIDPIYDRDYDIHEFMSMYFLMSKDFLNFLSWQGKSTDVIDLLFGVNFTNVINAIENRIDRIAEIPDKVRDSMDSAFTQKMQLKQELESAEERLSQLSVRRDDLENQIAAKNNELQSLKMANNEEERINTLRSRRSSLLSQKADIKNELTEKNSELAEIQRRIERYEDSELSTELAGLADELRDLMSVPDRCPVCMNDVDRTQRQRLRDDHECPLCAKTMPEDRLEKEREYQAEDSTLERIEEQQSELEDLQRRRNTIESKIDSLNQDKQRVEDQIEDVEDQISDSNFEEVVQRRQELEREIRELNREAATVSVDIESLRSRIEKIEMEITAQNHLIELAKANDQMISDWQKLRDLVEVVRKDQRRSLQRRLEERMDQVLEFYNEGIFSDPRANVSFQNAENYRFTVHTQDRDYQSSQPEQESSEATLHGLLFHTAILRQLCEEMEEGIPIRFLIIDSPYSGDLSPGNQNDVTNLLTSLSEYLEEFQVILTMAKSSDDRVDRFEESGYTTFNFAD